MYIMQTSSVLNERKLLWHDRHVMLGQFEDVRELDKCAGVVTWSIW